jgi:hypothetical protein
MKNLPQYIENQLFSVLNREISVKEFEQWVYQTGDLEEELSEDDYYDLISFNYNLLDAFDSLYDLLIDLVGFPQFEHYRLSYQLNLIIEKEGLWENAIEIFHGDYIEKYNFLEPFFSLHFMIQDNHEYYPQFNENKTELIDEIYVLAKKEALQLLIFLNSRKIIIKDYKEHRRHGENYFDYRTKEEKAKPFFDVKQTKNWWEFWKKIPPPYLH